MVEVVAVDGPHVVEAQLLEQRAAGHQAASVLLGPLDSMLDHPRESLRRVPRDVADRAVALRGDEPREISAHRADRRGDRHLVVVEDHDEAGVHRARVVQALVRHAPGERAVADDRDDPVPPALEIAGDGEPERGRNGGRGVRGAEGVVLALRPLGEAGQPASLAEGADPRAPAGQDLVRIALMADIPDQDVFGGIEQVVKGYGELDHSDPGPEVASGVGDRVDRLGAELVGEQLELPHGQSPEVVGPLDQVEMRGFDGHAGSPSSALTLQNILTKGAQRPGLLTESFEPGNRPTDEGDRLAPRALLAKRGDEGRLSRGGVLADRLPEGCLVADHVQDIVDDLEGKPHVVAELRSDRRNPPSRLARIAPASQPKAISAPVFMRSRVTIRS